MWAALAAMAVQAALSAATPKYGSTQPQAIPQSGQQPGMDFGSLVQGQQQSNLQQPKLQLRDPFAAR